MDSLDIKYNNIPHNTIQGIKKRLVYWKNEDSNLIRCANKENNANWYRNYYYKGHSYFALADFLQLQHYPVNAHWSFSNAKDFVAGKKKYGKQILNTKPQKVKQKHIPTTNAFTFREQQLYKFTGSLLGGGSGEDASMKDEMLGHLYHLSLEYMFKAIWFHSKRKSGASFEELNHKTINKKQNPIQTHFLLNIFNQWDKELKKAVEQSFQGLVEKESRSSGVKIQDDLIKSLKGINNVEIGLNRYNTESTYPNYVKAIFQDVAEFFFIYLFPLQDITGYDNEPLFTEIKGRNKDTNKKMSLKFWVHQPPNTK